MNIREVGETQGGGTGADPYGVLDLDRFFAGILGGGGAFGCFGFLAG